jgi:hypothetical protein
MTTSKNNMIKYIGAAAAVGGTMLLGTGLMTDKKSLKKKVKKTANKALDAMDEILCSVQSMVK